MEINIGIVPEVSVAIGEPAAVSFDMSIPHGSALPAYKGKTVVVPSDAEQILRTGGHTVNEDIVVKPIPSNYGRVSYNGFCLTIE